MNKLEAVLNQFGQSLKRLEEVLKQEKNEFMRDSAIKRFELTFDLSWKMIKAFLDEKKGVICTSPKDCFRMAYKHGLIGYDDAWIKMTDLRNDTAHTYKEELADKVYGQLSEKLELFQALLQNAKQQTVA